jgi:DNA-binding beta-propeller fold protein YncE
MYVSSVTAASVSVVDTQTDTIVRRYLVPGVVGVHISPDGKTLYAVTALGVLALDPQTGQQVAPFLATGTLVPTWMTETPDGSKLYLADTAGDGVSVVDAHTMRIEKTIQFPFGTSPIIAKVTPDGKEVWLANGASSYGIAVISTATDTLTKVIPTNGMVAYVSFSPDSKVGYVAEVGASANSAHLGLVFLLTGAVKLVGGPGDIRLISTATHEQVGPVVPTGKMPGDVATAQPGIVSGG